MSITIEQKPLYEVLPVGQQIIFTVDNTSIVQNYFNVKYLAEVHISTSSINLSVTDDIVATFKTTPNNKGVGIFDFQPLFESYVSSDNTGTDNGNGSRYKTVQYSLETPHPIHLIDRLARSMNSIRYFAIQFKIEGATTSTAPILTIAGQAENSVLYTFFNGVLQHDDYLTLGEINGAGALVAGNEYGYDLSSNLFYLGESVTPSTFLTNAPTTQYANVDDYGTMGFLNFLPNSSDRVKQLNVVYYNSAGGSIGSETLLQTYSNGGATNPDNIHCKILYVGIFPANLRGSSMYTSGFISIFQSLVDAGTIQGGYYTVQPETDAGDLQQMYTINVTCPILKGYEPIRLTWLNQWGVWDYYTFNMKSVRSTSTNRTTYTQMTGTWNDSSYRIDGYKGGKKNFRVNSTERIQVNTDFVTEADAVWFEELVNSQEVYILNGFDSSEGGKPYHTITNKYIEPVLVTTSSYVRQTIANDKLMQYTFELERNKTQKMHTS